MSRQRIENRTLAVQCHGAANLADYAHSFSHQGDDGSGKGNIRALAGAHLWGVVYELGEEQAAILHGYEVGYERIELGVTLAQSQRIVQAYAYISVQAHQGLIPTDEYLGHYMQGMRENQFPEHYVVEVTKQAGQ